MTNPTVFGVFILTGTCTACGGQWKGVKPSSVRVNKRSARTTGNGLVLGRCTAGCRAGKIDLATAEPDDDLRAAITQARARRWPEVAS